MGKVKKALRKFASWADGGSRKVMLFLRTKCNEYVGFYVLGCFFALAVSNPWIAVIVSCVVAVLFVPLVIWAMIKGY